MDIPPFIYYLLRLGCYAVRLKGYQRLGSSFPKDGQCYPLDKSLPNL